MLSSYRPRIRYAQNFLTDPHLVDRLLDLSTIDANDLVLEIGPGAGAITDRLARRAARVLAVERDPFFAQRIARRFAGDSQVDVRTGDFLDLPLPEQPYKVFASIPFNQTAAIVTRLIGAALPPDDAYLVVQREAASRFCGLPRTTLYALLLAPWFAADVLYRFRRCDFSPPPGVDVVLLRLAKRGPPLVAASEGQFYRDLVITLFTARRPSLDATLLRIASARTAEWALAQAGISAGTCPSEIPVARWLHLFAALRRERTHLEGRVAGAEVRLLGQQAGLRKLHRSRRAVSGPGPPCRAVYSAPSARRDTAGDAQGATDVRRPRLPLAAAQFAIGQLREPARRAVGGRNGSGRAQRCAVEAPRSGRTSHPARHERTGARHSAVVDGRTGAAAGEAGPPCGAAGTTH